MEEHVRSGVYGLLDCRSGWFTNVEICSFGSPKLVSDPSEDWLIDQIGSLIDQKFL